MPALTRSRLTLMAVVVALAGALPACGTDDAVERDTKDAQQEVDKDLGGADEEVGDDIEKGVEDVDGR